MPIISLSNDLQSPESQDKLCTSCHLPVADSVYLTPPGSNAPICIACRGTPVDRPTPRSAPPSHEFCAEFDMPSANAHSGRLTRHIADNPNDNGADVDRPPLTVTRGPASAPHGPPNNDFLLQRDTPSSFPPTKSAKHTRPSTNTSSTPILPNRIFSSSSRRQTATLPAYDPFVDITNLRVRSQGHHCLYPGATFHGTQKSGRNSYDVDVTIVDVDFSSSFLCGYLCIRGLTEDWPELTTYFDAEIIGSRYGFLTQNWGATEQEDMVHWQRFPAFNNVRNELKKPDLTMSDRDRGAVFMRWKERFLVPDHLVQDINGASFAGFYYVCVDFNPRPTSSNRAAASPSGPMTPEDEDINIFPEWTSPSAKPDVQRTKTRKVNKAGRSFSSGPRSTHTTATMSGFYFHQNSEPYQQLSLHHIPERSTSTFEFR